MARCPSCEKFTSLELQEPESPDSLSAEFNEDTDAPGFTITGTVRIVRTCADCGTEMKEATFDIDQEVELGEGLMDAEKEEAAKVPFTELSDAVVEDEAINGLEEGGGRYAKSYFGVDATFIVRAGDTNAVVARVEWSDKVPASGMEELT